MMAEMKRSIFIALVLAVPVELLNFFVFPYPIDVGLPDNASRLQQFVGAQWLLLHWPGLRLLDWLGDVAGNRVAILGLFIGGYIDTAVLIFAAALLAMWARHLASTRRLATEATESPDLRD
jgi:hypothetical protein